MKNRLFRFTLAFVTCAVLVSSCAKERVKSVIPQFVFKHNLNGTELQRNVMNYTNTAGNHYRVDELQYFISEIKVITADGQILPITTDNAIHYVDLDDTASLTWTPKDRLPVTDYASISFVLGINEAKNKTGLFVNPPERDMFWPDMMGGGYHYLKMNGQWVSAGDTIKPFNFHLGIGMENSGTKLVQNYFTVTLPLNVHAGTLSNVFTITMNIEKWFEAPNVWDWNVIGGQIMQNQDAMHKACENGGNAFSVSHEGKDIIYHD
jgi:hypothetical protein